MLRLHDMTANPPTLRAFELAEAALLSLPQVQIPLTHRFSTGVYAREIFVPKGTFIIGHQHKNECFNIVISGRARVLTDGKVCELKAPDIFVSGAGVRKAAMVLEDMRWLTIHPTDETNVEKLEELLIIKSDAFLDYEAEIKQLREASI